MKRFFSFAIALVALAATAAAQIVTTTPAPLQEESKNVTLIYNAASPLGNNGMKGLKASDDVYAHIGVITNKSVDVSDWKYGPKEWGDNAAKYKLTNAGTDLWKLNIGDIRTYFGITDATEHVEKIAVVFRTGDTKKEGKTASGGDIFVDVLEDGFHVVISSDATSNVINKATTINFTVNSTRTANIALSVNGTSIKQASNATSLSATQTFSKTGTYTVKATATAGGQTVTDEMIVSYPLPSVQANYPGGNPMANMGPKWNSDGSVTFCLAAPGKNNVAIVGSWDNWDVKDGNVMKYQDYQGNRFFWITVKGLDKKKFYSYYFLVDGATKVGDPYAELALDPYSDKWATDEMKEALAGLPQYPYDRFSDTMVSVLVGDNLNYSFAPFTIPNHSDLVIYELLLRDFTGTEGKKEGNGSIKLAMEKLPYLKTLGVNCIELMPIMEFNGNNSWGYNTNFYMAPDKAYGAPLDYKKFIDECHKLGMAVVLDLVLNQSDGLHPWYQMYPVASNPFYNATAPHDYSVLNDWKQENAIVRQHWTDVITYWMKNYNVDGFRFDLVKGLGDSKSYGSGTEAYNSTRVANMNRLNAAIKAVKPNGIHINENLAGAQEENEMAKSGQLNWANVNNSSCQVAMGFQSDSNLNRFSATNDSRAWGSTVSYAESHDEERMGYKQVKWGHSTVKANDKVRRQRIALVGAQMILAPGAHMIWQFSELGDQNTTKKTDGNDTDPKPVLWNSLNDPNVKGLYNNWCELIALRTQNPELFAQDATFSMNCAQNRWNNGRTIYARKGDKELILIANPGVRTNNITGIVFQVKNNSAYTVASKTFDSAPIFDAAAGTATLEAGSYVVLTRGIAAGIDDVVADTDQAPVAVGGEGCIVIKGDYNTARVYDLSGLASALTGLTPGVYVVNVDGNATKVVVK